MRRRRNEIGRLLRRLKGFRRIFTRFGKPGVAFLGCIRFALIVDAVRWCEHALVGEAHFPELHDELVGQSGRFL